MEGLPPSHPLVRPPSPTPPSSLHLPLPLLSPPSPALPLPFPDPLTFPTPIGKGQELNSDILLQVGGGRGTGVVGGGMGGWGRIPVSTPPSPH